MIEKAKKQKKCSIREEDISTLLQRYSANTVLALLQEVGAENPGERFDWEALVKKTSTGISNAREYQMLWRHLAYRSSLIDNLEDQAQPLDDDSDIEYDLEAFPVVSSEAAAEAAACVKVLIASGLPSDSSLPNSSTVEAPLTINIPNRRLFGAPSENSQSCRLIQGVNITIPVSVQKQHLPTVTSSELLENGSASSSIPARRKRKPWSEEEDQELMAAVKKCGEGNWAQILRGDFNGERTAQQLAQRFNLLRKRANLKTEGSGSRLSEVQEAARHAMSLALDLPIKNRMETCTNSPVGQTVNTIVSNSVIPTTSAEASLAGSSSFQVQNQTKKDSVLRKSSSVGQLGSIGKSQVTLKKASAISNFTSDSMVRATAFAAGARIASPTDAVLLLKAAQSKNAVHIKSSLTCGLATYPPVASRSGSVKAALPTVQHPTSTTARSFGHPTAVTSSRTVELPPTQEVTTTEENKVSELGDEPKERVQEDGTCIPGNNPHEEVKKDKAPAKDLDVKNQVVVATNPNSSLIMEKIEDDQTEAKAPAQGLDVKNQVAVAKNPNSSSIMEKIKGDQAEVSARKETKAAVEEKCGN
ncbi:Myb_DNA-binding domain-containing protein [Cephalotus follicularis]|uniref:Myb_DNA-binding domain-containing protein n=1 Tax=Cephalotus follicularis TaxID=3775 RepID=A0A1Q3BFS2_CEPFO|nr:Myb_DNA-binding domain-containing protein [Cephalotus follicularis]